MTKRKFKFRGKNFQIYSLSEVPKDFNYKILAKLEALELTINDEYQFWVKIYPKDSYELKGFIRFGNFFEQMRLNYLKQLSKKYEYEELENYGIGRHITKAQYKRFQDLYKYE